MADTLKTTPKPYLHEGREIVGACGTPRGKVMAIGAHGSIRNARPVEIGDSDWEQTMHDLELLTQAAMEYERLREIERLAGELAVSVQSYDALRQGWISVIAKARELSAAIGGK